MHIHTPKSIVALKTAAKSYESVTFEELQALFLGKPAAGSFSQDPDADFRVTKFADVQFLSYFSVFAAPPLFVKNKLSLNYNDSFAKGRDVVPAEQFNNPNAVVPQTMTINAQIFTVAADNSIQFTTASLKSDLLFFANLKDTTVDFLGLKKIITDTNEVFNVANPFDNQKTVKLTNPAWKAGDRVALILGTLKSNEDLLRSTYNPYPLATLSASLSKLV